MPATIKITILSDSAGTGLKDTAADVKKLGDTAKESGGGFSSLREVATGALRQVGALAVDALGQAAKAVGGFLRDSINVAGDFESGMNKFRAVAGAGVDTKGLNDFKQLFISLGRELPVSTSEVEQAAIEMVSGGIDPAIVKGGALRQTLNFAAASGMSLADAAATSAKFLAGWTTSSATAAEKVAFLASSTDDLTKAAAASSTTVAELRLGIFNVQGAAQALHAPFNDVVASLALLAPAFQSSAQAGTALNVFMTRLVPLTDPATMAMRQLGIITKNNQNLFFDAQGSFLGMGNAAQVLKEHLGGLTDEQKISYLHTLFGNDAMKVANLLMQDGAAGIEDMKNKMDAANGVSATAALMQQGYNVALLNAKGSVEALQITIGSYLLPVLTDLLNNTIAPAINQFTTLADVLGGNTDGFKDLVVPLQQVATFLQPIIAGFGSGGLTGGLIAISSAIDGILPGFNEFGSFVENLATALMGGDLSGALHIFASGVGELGPMLETALSSVGQAMYDWIAPQIPPMLAALGQFAQSAWNWIIAQAPLWGQQLIGWGQQLVDWVSPMIPPLLAWLGTLQVQAWGWIIAQAPAWGQQFLGWGQQLVGWIGPMIPPLLGQLNGLLAQGWLWVQNQAPIWGQQLSLWGQQLAAWIAPAVPPMLAQLELLGQQFLAWIGLQAAPIVTRFTNWATSFVAWIPGATTTFLQQWPGILDRFLTWIGSAAAPLLQKLVLWGAQFVAWIAPRIPGILAALVGVAAAILIFIGETVAVLTSKLIQWGIAMVVWIDKEVLPKLPGALANVVSTIQGWLTGTGQWLAAQTIALGRSIIDGIVSGVRNAAGSLMSTLRGIAEDALHAAMSALHIGSPSRLFADEIGTPIVQGIVKGIKNTAPQLQDAIKKLAGDTITGAKNAFTPIGSMISMPGLGKNAAPSRAPAKNAPYYDPRAVGMAQAMGLGLPSASRAASKIAVPLMQGIAKHIVGALPTMSDTAKKVADAVRVPALMPSKNGAPYYDPRAVGMAQAMGLGLPSGGNSAVKNTTKNATYNYTAHYNGVPRKPEQDFHEAQILGKLGI